MNSTAPFLPGMDASHFQGSIDWQAVRQAGTVFAFVKATEGLTVVDPQFKTNWNGLEVAGLLRGAYHFYEPADDATAQANFFLDTVNLAAGDLAPVIDLEVTRGVAAATILAGLKTWLEVVEQAVGARPILYTAPDFWNSLGADPGAFSSYPLWVAEYGVTAPTLPIGWPGWTFWQYTQSGTLAGVSGSVDQDWFQGTSADLKRWVLE